MTDLINWDEPIETVDGEPCEILEAVGYEHTRFVQYSGAPGYWVGAYGSILGNPKSYRKAIRNVSKPAAREPQPVQVGDRVTLVGDVTKTDASDNAIRVTFSGGIHKWFTRDAIHSIEPRPLKVGDRVKWFTACRDNGEVEAICRDGRVLVFWPSEGQSVIVSAEYLERIA